MIGEEKRMKNQIRPLMITILTVSAFAQAPAQTNPVSRVSGTNAVPQQTNEFTSRRGKQAERGDRDRAAKKRANEQRRLKLMERELKKIGVTEQQKAQISALQESHKEKMAASAQQIASARRKLSRLLDEGASMETLEAAIQEISSAQAEQLRILVKNRLEMERILGKEKNARFMENAREQFKKHGRRGGPPLPPRPGIPPTPETQSTPPLPPENPPLPGNGS
jgi:predicted transglutaminase-like cysteine proteinase